LIERCLEAVHGTAAAVVINDRLDLALAAGAHGVHLKQGSIPGPRARELAPPGFLIGQSVHSVKEAAAVSRGGGLDYIVLGTIFETRSKPGRVVLGPDAIGEAARAIDVPLLAIGGIDRSNVVEVAARGASGVAAIGLFAADDGDAGTLEEVVADLRRGFERSEAVRPDGAGGN
jgi:thiamine-phosphate pyrophosphorylase